MTDQPVPSDNPISAQASSPDPSIHLASAPAAAFTLAPPRSLASRIFLTQPSSDYRELRSGWRLLCYFVMVTLLILATNPLLHAIHIVKPWVELAGRVALFLAALLPALVMNLFERRPFASYGFPLRSAFGRNFWVGALWGLISLSVLLGAMAAAGAFHLSGLALSGAHIWKWAAFWAVVFLFVAFSEEFLLRGYSQFTLTKGIGFWPAAAIFSLLFGALHLGNGGESWIGAAAAGFIGLFFCVTLRRTGNLWWAVGFHAAWDWAESFLYSVPDSGTMVQGHLVNSSFQGPAWLTGGSVGPEGSLLVFVLIAAMMWLFGKFYPVVKYP